MTHFDYHNLSQRDQEERIRASRAKADMTRLRISLTEAAKRNHVPPRALVFWFPGSVVQTKNRRWHALPDDEVFPMMVTTTDGVLELQVRGSQDRTTVGMHNSAIDSLLRRGDPRPLRAMEGMTVSGYELETDPDEIELWNEFGELAFLEIYLSDGAEPE